MNDLIGVAFFLGLIASVFWDLKVLSRKRVRTEEEFEKGASESGSLIGAGVNALHGILDPAKGRGRESVRRLESSAAKNARGENNNDDSGRENKLGRSVDGF